MTGSEQGVSTFHIRPNYQQRRLLKTLSESSARAEKSLEADLPFVLPNGGTSRAVLVDLRALGAVRGVISALRRFRVSVVRECIREILRETLLGVQYDPEETPSLTRTLAESIKNRVKGLCMDRYKLMVHVLIGEQRGQGVKMTSRCFWDSDTDCCAREVYMNDSLVCVAAVYGVYYY